MRLWLLSTIVVAGLAACAAGPDRDANRDSDRDSVYLRHAGTEVDQVRFARPRDWQPVGDNSVVIDFGAGRHYLFDLSPPCRIETRFAATLRIDNHLGGTVNRFDHIVVGSERCRIHRIRPVDMDAVRVERDRSDADRAAHGEVEVENPAQSSGGT